MEIWKDFGTPSKKWQRYIEKSTKDGHKTILSAPWYLNLIKYGEDWESYYKIEPLDFKGELFFEPPHICTNSF